jgi:hypothetical protein
MMPSKGLASQKVERKDQLLILSNFLLHFEISAVMLWVLKMIRKAQVTYNTFENNIELKRYCNKKMFLSNIFFPVWIENIYFWAIMLIEIVWIDFKMSLQYFWRKKYPFIKMSFYLCIAILCAKILCVTWA